MKIKEKKLRKIINEEIHAVLENSNDCYWRSISKDTSDSSSNTLTVKAERIDILEDVLKRDDLNSLLEKIKAGKRGAYYRVELTEEESEKIASAIKSYLDYDFANLSYADQRALESILNNLPYLMRY